MARATRSTTSTHQQQQRQDQQRKRKRSHDHYEEDYLATKHLRTDDDTVNDLNIHPGHGLQILTVLELEDNQGLLDRVFDSHSLRSLLTNPSPLSIVRDAVHNLFPISSLPRARPSAAAQQQLRFCNLALSLLNPISISTPLHIQSILSSEDPLPPPSTSPTRKYALVQHLPAGDYWSSLDAPPSSQSNISLKDLPTGHAELVAILPSSLNATPDTPQTLASLSSKPLGHKKSLPLQRRVTTGSFLDYGTYASFAPSFDHDCELVGRRQLGEVLYRQEQRRVKVAAARRESLEGRGNIQEVGEDLAVVAEPPKDVDTDVNALLPREEVDAIKAAMNSLELENSIQQLLERNRLALNRLEELQILRLTEGSNSAAEEGSEEWETAQCILDSLTVLSSLRPRSSEPNLPSLVPPSPILRKLHRTLALEPSPGWHGTLPTSRTTALRDDSTVKVKTSAVGPTISTTSGPVPITATPVTANQPPPTASYQGYPYTYAANSQQAQQAYRAQGAATTYTPYKPSQAPAYFQGYVPPGTQQQQSYYNQQSYVGTSNQQPYGSGATTQQPYNYQSWFTPSQYPSQTTSGRGTPQPTVATPTTYGNFFNAATNPVANNGTPTPAVRTPAVANTVASNKIAAQQPITTTASWIATPQATAPTLPSHLRSATPSPAVGYLGGYQVQPPPATPAQ